MDFEVARRAIQLILRNTKRSEFTLCFHGGEPLLAPPEWLDAVACEATAQARTFGKACRFFLQTNATLVNDDYLSVLKKHQVLVGSSLDGPPNLNDQTRGLTERAIQGLRALLRAERLSGVMVILTPHNVMAIDEILPFLFRQGINVVQVNFVRQLGRVDGIGSLLTADQMLAARSALLRRMLRGERPVDMGTFRIVEKFLGKSDLAELNCTNPYCHAGIKMVLVDARGRLFPCGLSANLSLSELANCEQVDNASYRRALERFHRKDASYRDACARCDSARICSFGCSAERGIYPGECAATRLFHRQLLEFESHALLNAYQETRAILAGSRRPFPYRSPDASA